MKKIQQSFSRVFFRFFVVGGLFACLSFSLHASTLFQVFQDAYENDPTFKAASSEWLAMKEELPIAISAFLPQLNLHGEVAKIHTVSDDPALATSDDPIILRPRTRTTAHQKNFFISASQTIFNVSQWAKVKNAKATVKQAFAKYNSDFQDLIVRTADAYFDVLNASENLAYKRAQEKELARKLKQFQARYDVGLIAVTDVYDTRATYQTTTAERIAAENAVENAIENLRVITGKIYPELSGAGGGLPLVRPDPQSIECWVEAAQKQNYTLLSSYYATIAAKEMINVKFGEALPDVKLVGLHDYFNSSNANVQGIDLGPTVVRTTSGALRADFPIYQGGRVIASTKQARYYFHRADSERERVLRETIATSRRAYLGIIASISQVKAYKQSIMSSKSALKSNEAAYLVGTKTILDVLASQSALYENKQKYSDNQYDYLRNVFALKQAAGTLCIKDVKRVSDWLRHKSDFRKTYLVKSEEGGVVNDKPCDIPPPCFEVKKGEPCKPKPPCKSYYSIELFSASSEKEVRAFVQAHTLGGKVFSIPSKYRGSWRYSVFYGRYVSARVAKQSLKELPQDLRRLRPKVRKLKYAAFSGSLVVKPNSRKSSQEFAKFVKVFKKGKNRLVSKLQNRGLSKIDAKLLDS